MSSIYVGMDVHKESITVAVLPAGAAAPTQVDRLPNEEGALRRYLGRVATAGPLQVCYEASGASATAATTVGDGSRANAPSPIAPPRRPPAPSSGTGKATPCSAPAKRAPAG